MHAANDAGSIPLFCPWRRSKNDGMEKQFLQRRYLLSFDSRSIGHIFTDVLVIGAGAAGLRAAVAAADTMHVLVLTKGSITNSNTYDAQGGIAAVVDAADSVEAHIQDTISCGAGLGDEEVIRHVVGQAPAAVEEMIQWGLPVDRENGKISLGREGGHSANRIIHAEGDATGKHLALTLIQHAKANANVKVYENCFVLDLLTEDDVVLGALTYHARYGLQMMWARQTILAGGGSGMLWRETSNPPNATADALVMAFRAGAAMEDMEMMQFHPTTLYVAGATRALISEAVRGEGAHLLDRNGYRFMADYSPAGELAPRDLVSRAIMAQMVKTNATHVLLDVRPIGAERFRKRFPQISKLCSDFDIDVATDLIPVHPAAHYMVGGVKVDSQGRTSLSGLWACGEASCTGLHGANRLASNSLLEALVYGKECGLGAAQAAAEGNSKLTARLLISTTPKSDRTGLDLTDIRNSLRSLMWRNVGIMRKGERLAETRDIFNFWGRYVMDKEFFDPAGWEIQNMLTASLLIVECAFNRTETRGVHFREDFPDPDEAWIRHQVIQRSESQLIMK